MFNTLRIDGPNFVTDKGCVGLHPFQYADGGKSKPVSVEDWAMMRALFLASPTMLEALEHLAVKIESGKTLTGDDRMKLWDAIDMAKNVNVNDARLVKNQEAK